MNYLHCKGVLQVFGCWKVTLVAPFSWSVISFCYSSVEGLQGHAWRHVFFFYSPYGIVIFLIVNPLVPSRPHYGHCDVRNANRRESVKNWNFSFEVQIMPYTLHTFQTKNISIWNCTTIKIPIIKTRKYCKYLKIQ